MKKMNLLRISQAFTFLLAVTILTGCTASYHQQARVSLDRSKFSNSGPSFDDETDLQTTGENAAYIISESFTFGGGGGKQSRPVDDQYNFHIPGADNENNYFSERERKDFFTLSEGLEFIGKGNKEKFEGSKLTTSIYYLKLPVLLNYNYKIGANGSYLHGGMGPYAAAALFGHYKSDAGKTTLHFGSGDDKDFKRMDYGLAFNAGYVFLKKWDVSLGYDLGLRNLLNSDVDKQRNRTISFNIGYIFK